MMPDPETIYAYDMYEPGCLRRLRSRCDVSILPLGPDKISFEVRWTPRDSVRTQLLERHFTVHCAENSFLLTPAKVTAEDGKALVDEFTLGNPSDYLIARAPAAMEEILKGMGLTAIGEHITRSRLELWRVAAVDGQPEEEVETFWQSYLEAETAITWSWPGVDWSFLMNQDQADELRRSPFGP